jgi:hypothetical protein
MIGFELLIYDGKKELVTVAKNKEKIRISFVYGVGDYLFKCIYNYTQLFIRPTKNT